MQQNEAVSLPNDFAINQLMNIEDWREERGSNLFPTRDSLRWFIRNNRPELLESGHYLPNRGKIPPKFGPGIDLVIMEILRRRAQDELQAAGQ